MLPTQQRRDHHQCSSKIAKGHETTSVQSELDFMTTLIKLQSIDMRLEKIIYVVDVADQRTTCVRLKIARYCFEIYLNEDLTDKQTH